MTTPIEREALSDERIKEIGAKWLAKGDLTVIAFARAILAASSDEDRKLMEQALDVAIVGRVYALTSSKGKVTSDVLAMDNTIAALRSRLDGEKK